MISGYVFRAQAGYKNSQIPAQIEVLVLIKLMNQVNFLNKHLQIYFNIIISIVIFDIKNKN
jgi:hypothetical protein